MVAEPQEPQYRLDLMLWRQRQIKCTRPAGPVLQVTSCPVVQFNAYTRISCSMGRYTCICSYLFGPSRGNRTRQAFSVSDLVTQDNRRLVNDVVRARKVEREGAAGLGEKYIRVVRLQALQNKTMGIKLRGQHVRETDCTKS